MGKESKKSTSEQEGRARAGSHAGCKCVPRKKDDTTMWPKRRKPHMQKSATIGELTECRERTAQRSRRGGGGLWRKAARAACRLRGCCQNISCRVLMTHQVHILHQGSHDMKGTSIYSEWSTHREQRRDWKSSVFVHYKYRESELCVGHWQVSIPTFLVVMIVCEDIVRGTRLQPPHESERILDCDAHPVPSPPSSLC